MPLTPSEVEQTLFRKAFRGYDVDEVDAFLDRVSAELARLLGTSTTSTTGTVDAERPGAPAQGPGAAAERAAAEGPDAALRTLLAAQRTADSAVAEARAEAEQLLSSARDEAEQTLRAAREQAEALLGESRERAARLDEEAVQRAEHALGDLDRRRARLQVEVDELQAFEREYRSRLRVYVEGQLRELASGSGPDDDGVGVPIGASGAAVRRTTALRAVPSQDTVDGSTGSPAAAPEPAAAPSARRVGHVEALDPAAAADR